MPTTRLEPSGERVVLEHYTSSLDDHVIYLMHIASYRFADPAHAQIDDHEHAAVPI